MNVFRSRTKPADAGLDWMGFVPQGWKVRRLGYFFTERRQKVSDRDFAPLSVTMAGVVPQLEHVAKTDDGDNRKLACAGDFVINSRSDRKGSGGVAPRDGSVSLINTVLELTGELGIDFAAYLLTSYPFQEEFYRVGNGIVADMWTTKYAEMRNICLACPPADEQRRISTFLDRETARIDGLIEHKTRFIALLREKRQALITRAVTRGLDAEAPMKDSGVEWLGRVPAHWTIPKLRHIATVQTGLALGKGLSGPEVVTVPYLRVANVQNGYLKLDDVATVSLHQSDLSRYLLREGDVLMNEGGDNDKLGRGHVWRGEIEQCVHQNHVFAIRPHGVSSEWLNCYKGSSAAQAFFTFRAKQTTNLASISSSNLLDLPVPCPPVKEQVAILGHIGCATVHIDTLITKTERSITLLREKRTALITAAVTGKIDLTAAA